MRLEATPKRIRAFYQGKTVIDSENALLLYGAYYYPYFLFPITDVNGEIMQDQAVEKPHRWLGTARQAGLRVNGTVLPDAVGLYDAAAVDFTGLVAIRWKSMDTWYEEAEEMFVHPHDPYHRIDVIRSSRKIQVDIAGVTVAKTDRPVMLLETGLPVRWYLPKLDVRRDLLEQSETQSGCAYKGFANYYSARIGDRLFKDVAWYYDAPFREALPIATHVCFYNERCDFYIDGVQQPKAESHFADENAERPGDDPIDG